MEAAEAQSRRGLEETVRLLDEALEKMTVRAEREAKEVQRRAEFAAKVRLYEQFKLVVLFCFEISQTSNFFHGSSLLMNN